MIRQVANRKYGWVLLAAVLSLLSECAVAAGDAVTVDVPEHKVYVGQKASFLVHLKGKGPFVGAAHFALPQVPRAVIVKVGDAVVSSETMGDDTLFVQTHEFALFSQAQGAIKIPSFEVRFSNRDGFTGPAADHTERVPTIEFEVDRPSGSDKATFLVTTNAIEVAESWQPAADAAKQGDVFHRTITQKAENVAGMALAPPPTTAPDGVRVYLAKPIISDDTERGEFRGSRVDTLTYVMQKPGTVHIPAIKYVWWNPESKEFGSKALSAKTFKVAAVPTLADKSLADRSQHIWILWLLVGISVLFITIWRRVWLASMFRDFWRWFNLPDRVAARRLIQACHKNNGQDALAAWFAWLNTQDDQVVPSNALTSAVATLERQLFGASAKSPWTGKDLAAAFREQTRRGGPTDQAVVALAPLNPR